MKLLSATRINSSAFSNVCPCDRVFVYRSLCFMVAGTSVSKTQPWPTASRGCPLSSLRWFRLYAHSYRPHRLHILQLLGRVHDSTRAVKNKMQEACCLLILQWDEWVDGMNEFSTLWYGFRLHMLHHPASFSVRSRLIGIRGPTVRGMLHHQRELHSQVREFCTLREWFRFVLI